VNGRRPAPGSGTPLVVLRRRWRLVAVAALLGLAVAVVWSVWRTPIYESTASVLVSPTATPTGGEDSHGQLSMRDERQMVRSVAVASIITRRFRTSTTPEQLLRQVSVETSAESRVLRITFTDPVPATARTGADAFAVAYLDYRRQAVGANLRSLAANLTRDIADLTAKKQEQEAILAPDRQATTAERDAALTLREAYSSRIAELERQLRALRRVKVDPGSVLRPAAPPSRATGSLDRNAAIGAALGLLLGMAAAIVHDRTDRRLRGRDDLAVLLDRPVLTRVPPLSRWPRRHQAGLLAMRDKSTSQAAEAYRVLQSRVTYLADRLGISSIMVTSAASDEGKSVTAANLALALAEAERDVLLISADLRRPRIHGLFDLTDRSGLGELLSDLRLDGRTGASAEVGARITSVLWSVSQHLWVLVSHPAPPEVIPLLGSDAMRRLLEALRPCFDFIILDCPPVLAAADATALTPLVDSVLVVADRPSTDRQAVVRLREQLEQVGGKILGAVLNRDRSDQAGYQYQA
jgi:capsular exopolysaccharide synthesis family protein